MFVISQNKRGRVTVSVSTCHPPPPSPSFLPSSLANNTWNWCWHVGRITGIRESSSAEGRHSTFRPAKSCRLQLRLVYGTQPSPRVDGKCKLKHLYPLPCGRGKKKIRGIPGKEEKKLFEIHWDISCQLQYHPNLCTEKQELRSIPEGAVLNEMYFGDSPWWNIIK
jgi:hypothetical protein